MTQFSTAEVDRIRAALQRLTVSPVFGQAGRMVRFLTYAVDEVLAGRGHRINQFAIGVEVFDRDESFDPTVDSIVRVEASRLRSKLREYYDTVGGDETIRFELPKGTYELRIHLDARPASDATVDTMAAAVTGPPRGLSIAILPFEPISGNAQDQPLGDAIATQIIDALGRSTGFEVMSRKTSFAYRGKGLDDRKLGEALDADYLVDGNIQRVGDHLRIGVGLVDARSGVQVWRSAYSRDADDVFTLADDLSASITASLNLVLWRVAAQRAERGLSDDPDPAEIVKWVSSWLYFKLSRETIAEGGRRAVTALERFPDLGHLHALHAMVLMQQCVNCWSDDPQKVRTEALAAARRAVELEPVDCWVLTWCVNATAWLGEHQTALVLAERALAREPDNPLYQGFRGEALIHTNNIPEGLAAIDKAVSIGAPNLAPSVWNVDRGFAYAQLGQHGDAASTMRRTVQQIPGAALLWAMLANALGQTDEMDEARRARDEARRLSPQLDAAHLDWLYGVVLNTGAHSDRHIDGLHKLNP